MTLKCLTPEETTENIDVAKISVAPPADTIEMPSINAFYQPLAKYFTVPRHFCSYAHNTMACLVTYNITLS